MGPQAEGNHRVTVLFKLPPQVGDGDNLSLTAKPYGHVSLAPGDRVFLWWSEAQGGAGLVGHGICQSATSLPGLLAAEVEPELISDLGFGFGRDRLQPYRDAAGNAPEATLAKMLYKHALNKVVQITPVEEAFLDGSF